MNQLRILTLLIITLTTAACAGQAPKATPPSTESAAVEPVKVEKGGIQAPSPPVSATHAGEASAVEASDLADDMALIDERIRDPWEGYNRKMYRFNTTLDKFVLRPLAIAYEMITPDPVQTGITRFFDNLDEPRTAINQLLQGRPSGSIQSLGRFAVNTTVGLGGVFDPATRFGMPRHDEDFGQTLATWGWRESRFLVLPLIGPRTVRDSFGIVGDTPLSPVGYVDNPMVANGLRVLQLTNGRARALPMDKLRAEAADEYALVRDSWMQHRAHKIEQDLRE